MNDTFIPLNARSMYGGAMDPQRYRASMVELQGGSVLRLPPQMGARIESPNRNVADYYGAYKNMTGSELDASSMSGYGRGSDNVPPPFYGFGLPNESAVAFNARLTHAAATGESSGMTYLNNDFTSGLRRA
jgi:hypothetical protein